LVFAAVLKDAAEGGFTVLHYHEQLAMLDPGVVVSNDMRAALVGERGQSLYLIDIFTIVAVHDLHCVHALVDLVQALLHHSEGAAAQAAQHFVVGVKAAIVFVVVSELLPLQVGPFGAVLLDVVVGLFGRRLEAMIRREGGYLNSHRGGQVARVT
jgi:hypothetical protein